MLNWLKRDPVPEVCADVWAVVSHTRALTPLEYDYVAGALHRAGWIRYGVLLICGFFLYAGISLMWLGLTVGPASMAMGFPVVIGGGASAAVAWWLAGKVWRRQHAMAPSAYTIEGVLEEVSATAVNPSTGATARGRSYRLGPVDVHWPMGAESIYRGSVGRRVKITAALLSKSSPVKFGSRSSVLFEQTTTAWVLEFQDEIRIHDAIARYGRNMFLLNALKETMAGLALLSVAGLVVWTFQEPIEALGGWWGLAAFIALSLVSVLISGWIWVSFLEPLAVRWGFDTTPHSKRLRG